MYTERCVALEPAAASSSPVDVDFKDVFGGPPRRFSLHDSRRSFGRFDFDEVDTAAGYRSSWPGPNEKPVFGDETAKLRRHPSDDFYDDIFRGSDDSPRRSSSSRNLSPSLPYKSEPFSTSLPAQFSVPSMMTKAMDPPVFGSGSHTPHRHKEGASSAYAPSTPLSRFSSEAMQTRDDGRIGVKKSNQGDLLSPTIDESSFTAKTTTEKGSPTGSGQFHFSIYKWAGKGVPLLMSLRGGKSPTLQVSGKIEKSSSAKGLFQSDTKSSQVSDVNVRETEFLLVNDDFTAKTLPIEMESEKMNKVNTKKDIRANAMDEERTLKNPEESPKGGGEIKTSSCTEIGLSLRIGKENATVKQEMKEPKIKHPLHSLLHDEIEQGDEKVIKMAEVEESSERTPHVSNSNAGSPSVKKRENRRKYAKNAEANKSNVSSPKTSGENVGKTSKGKVKEFVKIFNTETPPKTNTKEISQSQSSRLKTPGIHKTESEVSESTTAVTDSKIPLANGKKMPDASFRVVENKKKFEKQQSAEKIVNPETRDNSSSKIDASPTSESFPIGSKVTTEFIDDPFLDNFQIKELSLDEDKLSKTEEEIEAIRASDTKIQLWSNGRKGNIRSLLSTLQFVLWPESGWKPVALVDIIEGNAVKRAYQRAMLCLHPDKLQQKGAAAHQKYMAEKVFDILQEAWDHFNSLGSVS